LSNDALLNTDRLIIQLDSLGRLNVEDDFTLEDSIPHNDFVVVDEMEGILINFNAKTLKCKEETYNVFTRLLTENPNIFCLDGDLHTND